jgi:hypothetical protein
MATETLFDPPSSPIERLRRVLLSAVIFLVPFLSSTLWQGAVLIDEIQESAVPWIHRVVLLFYPLDLLWVALSVLAIPVAIRIVRTRAFTWAVVATSVFAAAGIVSWLFNPSAPGAALGLRWIGLVAIAVVASQLDRTAFRRFVAIPLLATAAIQSVIVLWQHPGPAGNAVNGTGEPVAYGSAGNSYVIAFILLLALTTAIAMAPAARNRWWWLAAAGLCSAGIATSGSRTAVLGLFLIALIYVVAAISDRARYLPAAAVTALPFLAVAAAIPETWLPRFQQSLSSSGNVTSGRLGWMRDAIAISFDQPITGVGPGREALVAEEQFRSHYINVVWPVHSVPLLAAAELGIAMGVAYVGYLAAVAWRAFKTSPEALAVLVAVGVWMPLDVHAYLHPTAIIIAAVWAVTLDHLFRLQRQRQPEEGQRAAV